MSRQPKRPRTKQSTYFDVLDDGDPDISYEEIQVREGRLKKTGVNTVAEPLPVRTPLQGSSDAWMNLKAWKVSDDTELALDPLGGELYAEAVERHVMDDTNDSTGGVQVEKKRYIRSKVSVSLYHIFLQRILFI